ncbi:MAG: hypothetical protein ACI97A_000940 [Planctomycetota bacterium]|jgi:hypothetical protein
MNRPENGKKKTKRDQLLDEMVELQLRLEDLARGLFLSRPYSRDVVRSLPAFEMKVNLGFRGRNEGQREEMHHVLKALETHIDDSIASNAAFRPGVVYSFFSESADPEVGSPKTPRDVFAGYSETGVPKFLSMLDFGIEKKHPGVEHLAQENGQVVAIKSGREELVAARLPDFERRNRAYDIRGQVVLGHFHQMTDNGSERFAVTVQLVRSSTRSRMVRLGLNVIGLLPNGEPALKLILERPDHPLSSLMFHTDRALSQINQELKKLPATKRLAYAADCADRLLSEMTLGQERHVRRENWRTGHAKERAEKGNRPTGCARADLGRARHEQVLLDLSEKTFVILGPKGRIHVFNDAGKHVTSLQLEKRAIEQRMLKKRWHVLSAEDAQGVLDLTKSAFRAASKAKPAD